MKEERGKRKEERGKSVRGPRGGNHKRGKSLRVALSHHAEPSPRRRPSSPVSRQPSTLIALFTHALVQSLTRSRHQALLLTSVKPVLSLYPLSFILYPLSSILYPLSFILYPLSIIHYRPSPLHLSLDLTLAGRYRNHLTAIHYLHAQAVRERELGPLMES